MQVLNQRWRMMRAAASWLALFGFALVARQAHADTVTLKNGMQLQGGVGRIAQLAGNQNGVAANGEVKLTPIILVDDALRRTFFPSQQLQNNVPANLTFERIRITKRVATAGKVIGTVGPVIHISQFDEFGNRTYTMNTNKGAVSVVQGITEVTPLFTKVEGMQLDNANTYIWDMRLATNSIPRDVLSAILMRQIDQKKANDRLRIVRLYMQAQRYDDARLELQAIIDAFPGNEAFRNEVQALQQLANDRMLREINMRRDVGQHRLAVNMLQAIPVDGLSGEMLIKIRDALAEYEESKKQYDECLRLLKKHVEDAAAKDDKLKERLQPIHDEIATELNVNTLPRLADYLRLSADEKLGADQKLAIAITGWLLGAGSSGTNLAVALSSVEVRDTVRKYLNTKQLAERQRLIQQMTSMEGATPGNIAKLIANMKPPVATDPQPDQETGCYELTVPCMAETPEIKYIVQLPPEYDPSRRYPCVVTLGSGIPAKSQAEWWTGLYNKKLDMHVGLASRFGYIVISPAWMKPHQSRYEYSAREHAAVLNSLRDACRRFAIDTDRVFLSGHSLGGDAAWDIGLAHPDLWAGIVPIVATADKYVQRYWSNGRLLPMYFVGGEMDGNRIEKNAPEWDRYMTKTGYDVMVVDYLGRGHEHFQEEIHRIFDWMNLHRREFFPKEFACVSLRQWDNFFWFLEARDFPARAMVAPVSWPPPANLKALETSGKIQAQNNIVVKSGADKVTLWLSPEMVDFSTRIRINTQLTSVTPSLETLLEDVRTRGDRQHPFWAKVDVK